MDKISRNITLYLPIGVALIVAGIVVFYAVTAGPGTSDVTIVDDHAVTDSYMTHEIEADATLQDIEDEAPAEDVPAYEEPIEELTDAIEEAQENVSEDLEEGVNPFMDDQAESQADPLGTDPVLSEEGADAEIGEDLPAEAELSCDFDSWIGETVAAIDLEVTERPYRVLEPGAMYTTDHVPERINLHTDEEGTVLRVTCG